jgi:hypothetical protein
MDSRAIMLEKLVVGGHVNVAERQALGAVKKHEVAEIVESHLRAHGVFPDHRGSKAVYEGATLTQVPKEVRITWERAYPWDPCTVAERRTETFCEMNEAIHRFIATEWEAGIDGIELI